jgi:deazaflavin-dependent oxidoreductase (nitroreductase family)
MAIELETLADQAFCYLTTTGRVTGKSHEIEIWFAARGSSIYMLSGGAQASDWVRNIQAGPAVNVRIADSTFTGTGRIVTDPEEDAWARQALVGKYSKASGDLESWGRTSLPVAVDLDA